MAPTKFEYSSLIGQHKRSEFLITLHVRSALWTLQMIVNLFVFLQNITSAQKSVADRKICQYETLIKFDDVTVLMISAGNGQSDSLK